jgi:hypothetical protein
MADTAKTPERSPNQIAGDIAKERAQLGKAFDTLRGDLSAAADSDNQTIATGRRALLLVPAMAVAVAATAGGLVAGARAIGKQGRKD